MNKYPLRCFSSSPLCSIFLFFFFNDTATTEIYTLSLHDALPIFRGIRRLQPQQRLLPGQRDGESGSESELWNQSDRKSTRLNSSHSQISYAVFCLKKKNRNRSIYETYVAISTIEVIVLLILASYS